MVDKIFTARMIVDHVKAHIHLK